MQTELSLLLRAGDFWWVSDEVGKKDGRLKAKVVSDQDQLDQPPLKGWQYWDGDKWAFDTTMVWSRLVSPPYEIIVNLVNKAKEKHPTCAGRYLPVEGKHHRGRPVGFQLMMIIIVVIKILVS